MRLNASNTNFNEVQGRNWNLTEVKNKSVTINIDRTKAPIDIYTIKFESTHLTGSGAVNFYSASYAARGNHMLSIAGFARVRDDTLYETENFTEYEYFRHLQRVTRWDLHNGKLELHTYDEYGARVSLIFSLHVI
jgi:heat shock protein HslJ